MRLDQGHETSEAITVHDLTKKYHGFTAVDHIFFTVHKGDIFGFLGPNGAGKTTTIRMLTTLLKPSAGTAALLGNDILRSPLEVKKHIGFMPDVAGFYSEMKAEDILSFYAEFYHISLEDRKRKIQNLFDTLQLNGFEKKKVKTYSRGMKQKLAFASSLLNDPEILILDEPTVGLDPPTIHFFRTLMRQLNKQGVTIFLSSHILSEVEALCNRVCIINKGKIVAVDRIDTLSARVSQSRNRVVTITFEQMTDEALNAVRALPRVISITQKENTIVIELQQGTSIIPEINRTLVHHNINVTGIASKEADLEDIFLSLIGGTSHE